MQKVLEVLRVAGPRVAECYAKERGLAEIAQRISRGTLHISTQGPFNAARAQVRAHVMPIIVRIQTQLKKEELKRASAGDQTTVTPLIRTFTWCGVLVGDLWENQDDVSRGGIFLHVRRHQPHD